MSSLNSAVLNSLIKPAKGWRFLLIPLAVLGLSGCSVLGLQAPWAKTERPDYTLISDNLVNTAAQIPHLNPLLATVQVSKPKTTFDKHVQRELAARGYKLEEVGAGDGVNVVKSQVRRVPGENGAMQSLYVLAIGQVSVERAYDTLADKTVPVSEQVVRGSDQRSLALNDDIFEVPNSPYSNVAFGDYDGPQIKDVLEPDPSAKGTGLWRSPRQNAVKRNIYETMASNYQDVFTDYENVEQSILVFPNDSLRMGDTNKEIIERYVEQMDPETDILSVIGCSHGQTNINNGNSLLALGRANRVKEALMFSGIEHDQVLEEGCWAPQTFDDVMPNRGVVLTLKRRSDS
jgi:hypothetical protein